MEIILVDKGNSLIPQNIKIQAPDFRNRSPEQIIKENIYFDSVGYAYRSLSWLDIAKKDRNVCALYYAALESRQAIEQLLFEELVMSVGTKLDRKEYEKCKGNSTKFHKIIQRLNPDYEKLAEFTKATLSVIPNAPNLIIWDHKILMQHWGKVSIYLHWGGEPAETTESDTWFNAGVKTVESSSLYIWETLKSGLHGITMPNQMEPEIHSLWERFKNNAVDIQGVIRTARIALPILERRFHNKSH